MRPARLQIPAAKPSAPFFQERSWSYRILGAEAAAKTSQNRPQVWPDPANWKAVLRHDKMPRPMPPHTYPLLLDVTDRSIVIVGGGAVAVRKAEGLLAAGATRV